MFEERPEVQDRLATEIVAWLTTVSPDGQPQSSPVWFLARVDTIVVYSLDRTPRTRNIRANRKGSLNLNSPRSGGQLVIIEGEAEIVPDGAPADGDVDYVAKYEAELTELGMTPRSFA